MKIKLLLLCFFAGAALGMEDPASDGLKKRKRPEAHNQLVQPDLESDHKKQKQESAEQVNQTGWNSLPEEIKQLVISYVVALNRNHPYDAQQTFKNLKMLERINKDFRAHAQSQDILLPLMRKIVCIERRFSMGTVGSQLLINAVRHADIPVVCAIAETAQSFNLIDQYGNTLIINAGKTGNKEILEMLIQNGALLSQENFQFLTSVMLGKKQKVSDLVDLINSSGTEIYGEEIADESGMTSLMLAASNGDKGLVEYFLAEEDVDVNLQDDKGKTGLIYASYNGHSSVVDLLIRAGACVTIQDTQQGSALMYASMGGHVSVMKLLLRVMEDDLSVQLNRQDKDGRTALMHASIGDHFEAVKLLVEHGADVNKIDERQKSALFHAARKKRADLFKYLYAIQSKESPANIFAYALEGSSQEIVAFLIEQAAHVNYSEDPLVEAVYSNQIALVPLLIEYGARIKVSNKSVQDALHGVTFAEIAKLLVSYGADINAQNHRGETALITTVSGGYPQAVKYFLEQQADTEITNKDGNTALVQVITKTRKNVKNATMLINHGANINARDREGNSCLMRAVKKDLTRIVQLLLERGADLTITNHRGQNVFDVARDRGHKEIQDLLNQHKLKAALKNSTEASVKTGVIS